MELAFDTKPLRDTCESEELACQELGVRVAGELKLRLADLRAATTIKDLPLVKLRIISGKCIFELADGYRLVVVPNHVNNPMKKPGSVNWEKVERIKIIGITRNHE